MTSPQFYNFLPTSLPLSPQLSLENHPKLPFFSTLLPPPWGDVIYGWSLAVFGLLSVTFSSSLFTMLLCPHKDAQCKGVIPNTHGFLRLIIFSSQIFHFLHFFGLYLKKNLCTETRKYPKCANTHICLGLTLNR